ncbi:MAG: cytochrome c [Holophagaceae bacterium]|nr:cytochrome c [Holophagaceae bacterium]
MLAPLLITTIASTSATTQARDLKTFYLRTCATCHGVDGSGRAPDGKRLFGRNLADAKWQAKQKDSDLVKIIFLGKGSMPGFRGQLTEDECRQMVSDILRPMAAKK